MADIELFYKILKLIGEILHEEPLLLHVPARLDREAQHKEIHEVAQSNQARRNLVVTSNFGQSNCIVWPFENLQVTIDNGSAEVKQLLPTNMPFNKCGQQLVQLVRQLRSSCDSPRGNSVISPKLSPPVTHS